MDTINPILIDVCSLAEEQYISEALAYYDSLPEFEYSEQFEKRMEKLCSHMSSGKYKRITKPFKALLVAAIITTIITCSATAVPPTKALSKNYDADINCKRALLTFKVDTNSYGTLYSEYDIPEDYTVVSHTQKDDIHERCYYEDSNGNYLSYGAGCCESGSTMIDTEGAIEVSEIPLHGTTAFFVHGDGECYYICWAKGEYYYTLSASTDGVTKEEFLEIAKSRENVR